MLERWVSREEVTVPAAAESSATPEEDSLDHTVIAIEKRDAKSVTRIAHTLKGSSGNMGARRMSRLCFDLEQAGESNDLSAAASILQSLNQEFDRVGAELTALAG